MGRGSGLEEIRDHVVRRYLNQHPPAMRFLLTSQPSSQYRET